MVTHSGGASFLHSSKQLRLSALYESTKDNGKIAALNTCNFAKNTYSSFVPPFLKSKQLEKKKKSCIFSKGHLDLWPKPAAADH